MKLSFKQTFKLFIRSFFIQSVWNYQSLISLGFCFSLLPIREDLKKKGHPIKNFVHNNIQFFNSHPYFASFALGVLYRLYDENQEVSPEKLEKIKNLLISPLGALGDKLFWNMIKPTAMMLAVLGGLLELLYNNGYWIIAIAFLVYNIPHIYFRWYGIVEGYKLGIKIYNKLNFESIKKLYKLYMNLGRLLFFIIFLVVLIHSWKMFLWNGWGVYLNIVFGFGIHIFHKRFFTYLFGVFLINLMIGIFIL